MRKDFADSFAAEGEGAREILALLPDHSVDALDLTLSQAPEGGSSRERYRYAKDNVLPLLAKIEDPGERNAALADVTKTLKLGVRDLRDALAAAMEQEEESCQEEEGGDAEASWPGPLSEEARELIAHPGVLNRYVEDVADIHGVVKDRGILRLQVLVATGAQLEPLPNGRPAGANLVLTAEAGRGKNYICDAAATALPEEFYLPFESASAKSLYYRAEGNPAVLKHRWIYPNEAEAADDLTEMFRPLLSGGKASHLTVNKDAEGRNAAQELALEGPVSVTIPTVRNKLDTQLQTRTLLAELKDYEGRVAEHSRATSRQLLPNQAGEDHTPKIRAWQAALRSLSAVRRVVFPLDRREFCFGSDEVSHGARLWGNLLGLMCAHAWLEQRNREIMEFPGGGEAVVATPQDYEAAYGIFEETCERSVVNLSETHRKILDAVYALQREGEATSGHSLRKIADKADVHHSTVSEHKTYLTKSVKLLREAEGGGLDLVADAEPSWWQRGDLLVGLPRPGQVWRWWEERDSFSGPETARQSRQYQSGAEDRLTYAENPVGHPTRHPSDTARHPGTGGELSGGKPAVSDEAPDRENGLGKRKTENSETLSGVSGTFGGGPEENTSERERFAL